MTGGGKDGGGGEFVHKGLGQLRLAAAPVVLWLCSTRGACVLSRTETYTT